MEIIEVKEFTAEGFEAARRLTDVFASGGSNPLTEARFREIIASGNSHFFFIAEDGNIAGMLTVGVYKSPTGTKAWIEDVAIDDFFRGKGLGKLIVQHAVGFAQSLGADTLMLTSNPARVAANKLYQALGLDRKETNVYRIAFNKD